MTGPGAATHDTLKLSVVSSDTLRLLTGPCSAAQVNQTPSALTAYLYSFMLPLSKNLSLLFCSNLQQATLRSNQYTFQFNITLNHLTFSITSLVLVLKTGFQKLHLTCLYLYYTFMLINKIS